MERKGFWQSGHKPSLFGAFLYFDISFMIWGMLACGGHCRGLSDGPGAEGKSGGASRSGRLHPPTRIRIPGGSPGSQTNGSDWNDRYADPFIIRLVVGRFPGSIVCRRYSARWLELRSSQLCHWRDSGIPRNIKVWRWELPVPVTAARSSQPSSPIGLPNISEAGRLCSDSPLSPSCLSSFTSLFARNSPNRPAPKRWSEYGNVLAQRDAWVFCALYCVTFGGFVGLANYLTIFFNTQYGLSAVQAADITTICVIAGSFFRPCRRVSSRSNRRLADAHLTPVRPSCSSASPSCLPFGLLSRRCLLA